MLEFEVPLVKSLEFKIKVLSTLGSGEWQTANANARRFFLVVQLCLIDNSSKKPAIFPASPISVTKALYFAWRMIQRATTEIESVTWRE